LRPSAKHGDFVGFAIAIGVFEDFDAVARFGARLGAQGKFVEFQHPEPAPFVPGHRDGVDHFRLGSEEANFEPSGKVNRFWASSGDKAGVVAGACWPLSCGPEGRV